MTTPVKNSVPGKSSLSVPQELIEFTLDFLHSDVPTLRTCSLVSRAFLPCSRYHIYSNVFIVHIDELDLFRKYAGQLYQYQNLAALLEHSSHLAPLVTRFGIHGKPQWMTDVLMYTSLFPIIQSLHNLSHLEFIARSRGEFQFWVRFPDDRHSFLAALRSLSLKTLILKGFNCLERNAYFEDVCSATAANSALKHLSLLCCYGGVETFQPHSPIRTPLNSLPALESLSISGRDTSCKVAWMFFTQSLYNVSSIRRLSLQIYSQTNSSVIQSLLNEVQETLESFTLDICPGKTMSQDGKVDFDLSRHRNLSSFYTIVTDFTSLDSVPRMRLSPTLRTLTVEHVSRIWEWKSPRPARPWAGVDRLALPALEHVHVKLHDAFHDMCYYYAECYTCDLRAGERTDPGDLDNWKRQVEKSMPLLKERGILEVEVVKRQSTSRPIRYMFSLLFSERHCVSEGFD
ncbi:hypothetical protein EV421DRAFT_1357172 [Armillaria borealis]|uniref:Uncharacterized protein n=1 Tax=Armillaria borealis TaxID=47425 RepID=A0AA39MGN5_9AGAR|nr:hypothetical protein EV421DRAFT_1357172 [Armillaria borealis]